jgi:hypothetical protein
MQAMLLSKLKTSTTAALLVLLIATGAAGLAVRAKAEGPNQAAGQQQILQIDEGQDLEKELRRLRAELDKARAEIDKLKGRLAQVEAGRKVVGAEKAGNDTLVVKVYPVADLVNPDEMDDLITFITKTIEPKKWTPSGASIHFFAKIDGLVISQSVENHQRVQALLDALRKAKTEQNGKRK